MSTCEKAGAEATSVVSSDRVSSLPPEIKGDILSRLLVEEAVRTSILSSTWRNAWTDMPRVFLQDGKLAQTKFVTLVDMVLALHKGTIEEFNISVRFEGIRCLNIQAPKLEYLEVVGGFEDINLDAPNLEWAVLTLNPKAKAYQSVPIAHDTKNYVKKSLGSHLSKGCIPMKLPAVFTRLEHIYLTICFWDQRQVLAACSLFQNAPNLKRLNMRSRFPGPWYQDQASIQELTVQLQMDHLVTASMEGFAGLDYEVDFVAKLLSWAPALEELEIEWEGETDCSRVLAKLLALPRVSPRAKVIVTF
uniref:F-box domain-containing protein n=1 Tax=Aegilops tauschii TaxID=37682 RepID=M8AZP6_AEGTA